MKERHTCHEHGKSSLRGIYFGLCFNEKFIEFSLFLFCYFMGYRTEKNARVFDETHLYLPLRRGRVSLIASLWVQLWWLLGELLCYMLLRIVDNAYFSFFSYLYFSPGLLVLPFCILFCLINFFLLSKQGENLSSFFFTQ